MVDRTRLKDLAGLVGAFHLSDRTMKDAQARIERALSAGDVGDGEARAYCVAVRRYFAPYEREALGQLRHVDRELERLYQLQFNLTAERAVVAKRVDGVRGVLAALAELAPE
ncbi:MAG: hypothetical protein JOZ24_06660 [Candidatus Eremiobacteraeota bacterium]|nr:hypothetical protein [Candidatus Eremiobacteraeota bacterium]